MKKSFADALEMAFEGKLSDFEIVLERPKSQEMGDVAFPCFRAAKALGLSPAQLASQLAQSVAPNLHVGAELIASGPYLNLKLCPETRAETVLASFLGRTLRPEAGEDKNPRTILVEYSSPNIAKLFTIGHLRSTMIGHAIVQVNRYLGQRVVRLNHLGDWGTQFGALLAAYKQWAEVDNPQLDNDFLWAKPIPENRRTPLFRLFQLYVRFHDEEQENEGLRDEARIWFKRLEAGDGEAQRLWGWFREISLAEFQRIYDRLGVSFDSLDGESFYTDKLAATIGALSDSGLLEEGEGGSRIIPLEDVGIQAPCIVLKGDGASIYATRDLAAAIYRKSSYNFDQCAYVVGSDQVLHFQQIFAVLNKLDPWFKGRMAHTPFGMVKLPEGKMSTRQGNVVFLEDVLDESVNRVLAIIEEKNPGLGNKLEIAEMLGIGAVIFFDALNDRVKSITFTWDRVIALDGDTGPYVQYAHARICSVLRKAGGDWIRYVRPTCSLGSEVALIPFCHIEMPADMGGISEPPAQALLYELAGLHDSIYSAQRENMATALARQLISISRAFSSFYTNCPILTHNNADNMQNSRIYLCIATARALRQGLWLMGIRAPEEM
ncbi:MAG: arginine--tRNA ligase [Holophagaceae bacterium]|nr:arginine--tRNA ligase [Holophagaceae bacterium]